MQLTKKLWSASSRGDIFLYTLSNGQVEISVSNLGCIITAIHVPDAAGQLRNIVLGSGSVDHYLIDPFYIGAVVGRYANRIDGGRLPVGDRLYQLSVNEPANNNHLHGGFSGFDKKIFTPAGENKGAESCSVRFKYRSPHLEEGYPGNLDLLVSYELTASNDLIIGYHAETDEPTHVNLTNHTYFNLGDQAFNATGHELLINSGQCLESGDRFLPSGKYNSVHGTPFDFRKRRPIDTYWTGLTTKGYNTYYFFDKSRTGSPDAVLSCMESGISVALTTSFPGMVLYTGDYLEGLYRPNQGVCLEAQFPPNAPNQKTFPSTLLKPGKAFIHHTTYNFRVE